MFGVQTVITNCIFIDNSSQDLAGAIYNGSNAHADIANSTFVGNNAAIGGAIVNYGYSELALTSCILWDNSDNDGSVESSQIHLPHCSIVEKCVYKVVPVVIPFLAVLLADKRMRWFYTR